MFRHYWSSSDHQNITKIQKFYRYDGLCYVAEILILRVVSKHTMMLYVAHFRAYIYILIESTNTCTIFLFYIYFHFFSDMFPLLHAILKGVHSNYIKMYRSLIRDP
jgi:hypothetical protein